MTLCFIDIRTIPAVVLHSISSITQPKKTQAITSISEHNLNLPRDVSAITKKNFIIYVLF